MMTPATAERLTGNLQRVRSAIASACGRAGRAVEEVRLVGVTKYVVPEVIAALHAAGLCDLAENRPQQLVSRAESLGGAPVGLDAPPGGPIRWHMIGHLQRNKVRRLLGACRILHSLDSRRLAEELERQAGELAATVDVLIEVNVSGEASKGGVSPAELPLLTAYLAGCRQLRLRGLMTMAPLTENPQDARPHFARLRELLEALRRAGDVPVECRELSMGMTSDFPVAVEEGATLVRIGSALFEGLLDTEASAAHAGG